MSNPLNDGLFHEIIDAQIVIKSKGVCKQVPLFHRGDRIYAKAAGGFIRLGKEATSHMNWMVDGPIVGLNDSDYEFDRVGYYVYLPGKVIAKLKAV